LRHFNIACIVLLLFKVIGIAFGLLLLFALGFSLVCAWPTIEWLNVAVGLCEVVAVVCFMGFFFILFIWAE